MLGVMVGYHAMPDGLFRALAAGGGGPDALSELRQAQYSKHLLLLRGVLERGGEQAGPAYLLLAKVQRHDPAARAVIGHPSVGAWAQYVNRGVADPRQLGAVAAAAAIRAGMAADIEVPVSDGTVVLPTLGAAILGTSVADGATATISVSPTSFNMTGRDLKFNPLRDRWLPIRTITAGSRELLLDDVDPFRMPALGGAVAPRLTDADAAKWAAGLREAWPLLDGEHPEVAAELETAVATIVPHRTPASGHSSSTSAETFGAVALSEPLDAVATAVSLTHELQHLKLFALLDMVTMLAPDDGSRYYAPWRPDPRPLGGLLQGAYAFLGVSGFWRKQRHKPGDDGATHVEYAKWLAATSRVIATLNASGKLTEAGEEFVHGMARTAAGWCNDAVPEQARRQAEREAAEHEARWVNDNGPISPAGRSRS
jgi:HEXXH motif-containing protein